MARQFKLSASDMEVRLAYSGFTIRVEDDNQDLSGQLQITQAGITWSNCQLLVGENPRWSSS